MWVAAESFLAQKSPLGISFGALMLFWYLIYTINNKDK